MAVESSSSVATIVAYGALLAHEETLVKAPHSVMSWYLYLMDIDSVLDELSEYCVYPQGSSSNHKFVSSHNKNKFKPHNVGGKFFAAVDELRPAIGALERSRVDVGERALAILPGSYKLWKTHLEFRLKLLPIPPASTLYRSSGSVSSSNVQPTSAGTFRAVQSTFERAMVRMNKMPVIWRLYLDFVTRTPSLSPSQQNITSIRNLFDRALLALPVTQHEKIWEKYTVWVKQSLPSNSSYKNLQEFLQQLSSNKNHGGEAGDDVNESHDKSAGEASSLLVPMEIPAETTLRVLRRYALNYNPTAREDLAMTCFSLGRYGECALLLIQLLNDVEFISPKGTIRHDLWMAFCETATKHPEQVQATGIDFDKIVRAALQTTTSAGKQHGMRQSGAAFGFLINQREGSIEEKLGTLQLDNPTSSSSALGSMNFGEMEGTLWCKLADYYTRLGEFEAARSIYEEALESVTRVRDFSLVFDAYSRFEEATIAAHMTLMEEDDEEDTQEHQMQEAEDLDEDAQDLKLLLDTKGDTTSNSQDGIELEMARAEYLMERRPLMLNRVLLKQNPHNVQEWLHRAELYQKLEKPNSHAEAVAALEEGCRSVNANQAVAGNPCELWIALAKLHEERGDKDKVRKVFERVCIDRSYRFKTTDDFAQVWTAWVEYELRIEDYDEALSVIRQAIAAPSGYGPPKGGYKRKKTGEGSGGNGGSLHRSLRLWNLALDLEESLGGLANGKAAYTRCIELGVATPQIILNYASLLGEHKYFEESFTAYENGVDLFPFPHPGASHLWSAYLKVFHKRYKGAKMERSRELFERCVENVPAENASEFYLLYADFEEKHGLAKRALSVYERLCTAVPSQEKLKAYKLYIAKAVASSGALKTRPIYEAAIAALSDRDAAQMCLQFANLETQLGELDRARAALTYGAQMADPRRDPGYWKEWHAFEVAHGDEESFREMLRVKRSVAAAFSTVNYNALDTLDSGTGSGTAAEASTSNNALTEEEALKMIEEREGVKHTNLPAISGFVSGKRSAAEANLEELERKAARLRQATAPADASANARDDDNDVDEEIDLDEDAEDEDGGRESESHVGDVATKEVPAAVFGGLAADASSTSNKGTGALERLRAAAKTNE
jgi:pre-mRNA-splicing factor SYF1